MKNGHLRSTRNVCGLSLVLLCLLSLPTGDARGVESVWIATPPRLDGVVQPGEWNAAANRGTSLPHGLVFFQHDSVNLYVLIDLTGDTHVDPLLTSGPLGDYLSLSVDMDRNRMITPNVDVSYGLYQGRYQLGVQTCLRPGAWTGLNSTQARLGIGFGSSSNAPVPHVVWEIALPLREINAESGRPVRLGLRTHSQTPFFDDSFPADLNTNFANLLEVSFGSPPGASGAASAQVRRQFHVSSTFGDRDRYQLKLTQAGRLKLNVAWSGTAQNLALILNGPGQTNYYARQDGRSPLAIDFELTPDLLKRGDEWLVSIVNFSKQGSAQGTLLVEYPVAGPTRQRARAAPSGGVQRTITADGSVEVRYPDGAVKRHGSGKQLDTSSGDSGSRVIYMHVQPDTPPSLPSDPQILGWLEWSNNSLLEFIRGLVGNDEAAVNYYLEREKNETTTLYQRILLRTEVVNQLLTPD